MFVYVFVLKKLKIIYKLYVIILVKIHNFGGKLYMAPVSIIHPYIVYNIHS